MSNTSDSPAMPQGMAEHEWPGRRTVVKACVGVFGASYATILGYPVYRYLATPARRAATAAQVSEVTLADADQLEAGAALMFRFGTRPAVLIHRVDGSWVAFDAVCSHLGCTVQYQPAQQRIFCACHNGVYDPETGTPISGPPPKALAKYTVEVRDGEVLVARG